MGEREERNEKKRKEIVIDVDKILGFATFGLSCLSLGISLYSVVKLKGFSRKIDMSIDDLSRRTHVEITDNIVNRYTEKAVRDAANRAAGELSEQLRYDMQDILSNKVGEAVSNQYDLVKDEVSKELRKKVNAISISALKAEIKDEATRSLTDKLATQMDDIIATQTDRLENMAKAYKDMGEFIKTKAG